MKRETLENIVDEVERLIDAGATKAPGYASPGVPGAPAR